MTNPSPAFLSARSRAAFTLIELLVVLAILALLAALLFPALTAGKERARRARCLSNVRQFLLAAQMYAQDNRDLLPSGLSENSNPADSHTPVISTTTRSNLIHYCGTPTILECPGLGEPFGTPDGYYYPDYGYVIGYNYLGGHTNTPWPRFRGFNGWTSPRRTIETPTLVLVAELNAWSPGYAKTFAPHGALGPLLRGGDFSNESARGASSRDLGAKGGNVGLLDGSVRWVPINQMQPRRGSYLWGSDGCFTVW